MRVWREAIFMSFSETNIDFAVDGAMDLKPEGAVLGISVGWRDD